MRNISYNNKNVNSNDIIMMSWSPLRFLDINGLETAAASEGGNKTRQLPTIFIPPTDGRRKRKKKRRHNREAPMMESSSSCCAIAKRRKDNAYASDMRILPRFWSRTEALHNDFLVHQNSSGGRASTWCEYYSLRYVGHVSRNIGLNHSEIRALWKVLFIAL